MQIWIENNWFVVSIPVATCMIQYRSMMQVWYSTGSIESNQYQRVDTLLGFMSRDGVLSVI